MADDLNRLINELERIQKETRTATEDMVRLAKAVTMVGQSNIPMLTAGRQQNLLPAGAIRQGPGTTIIPTGQTIQAGQGAIAESIIQFEKEYSRLWGEATNILRQRVTQQQRINAAAANITGDSGTIGNIRGIPEATIPTGGGAKVGNLYNQLAGGDPEKLKTLTNIIPQLQTNLDKLKQTQADLGNTLTETGVRWGKYGEEFAQVVTTVKTGTGEIGQFNQYIVRNGEVLTETALREQQAAAAHTEYVNKLKTELGPAKIEAMEKALKKYGFTLNDLQKTFTQQPSGVTFATFGKMGESGIPQKMGLTIDPEGKILTQTSRRLLDFTHSIIRNTSELIKWSVGVGLVYGSMYRLKELISLAIDNQTKLADITITLGNAQRDVNDIFADAAKVAYQTGESINGVLETYTMAYRAVGGIVDPIERTTAANKLLTNATILNKLSNLDAASSIDMLAGALRQTAAPGEAAASSFERGTMLLDKWVAVANKANVGLGDLAEAFSVTAESALNSGASIDQVNAMIAVLAEKIGGLGGRETGNAVRALIGGVYQQQSIDVLAKYGIAVKDSTGQMRDFMNISRDISELWKQGIIDDTQINKIGYVLGGGVRRGQQYVAFLTDLDRMQEIVAVSAGAQGNAQSALAKKLDTVQTESTRVNNAFQELAQTIGTEGGILGTTTLLLKTIEGLVGGLTKLTDILGGITVPAALITMAGIYSMLTGYGGAKIAKFQTGIGTGLTNLLSDRVLASSLLNERQTMMALSGAQKVGGFVGKYGFSMALGAMPAMGRFGEGNKAGGYADIAGALAGAILTKGSVIGTTVGAFIADAFVARALAHEPDFQAFFKEVWVDATKKEEEKRTIPVEEATFIERGGALGPGFGKVVANLDRITYDLANRLGVILRGESLSTYKGLTMEQAAIITMGQQSPIVGQIRAQKWTTPTTVPEEQTQIYALQKQAGDVFEDFITGLVKTQRDVLTKKLLTGEVGAREFQTGTVASAGFSSVAARYIATMLKSTELTTENKQAIEELGDVYLSTTEDNQVILSEFISKIYDLNTALETLKDTTPGTEDLTFQLNAEEIKAQISTVQQDFINAFTSIQNAAKTKIDIPGFMTADVTSVTQLNERIEEAKRLQQIYFDWLIANNIKTAEEIATAIEQADPIYIKAGESMAFAIARGIVDSNFIQQALQEATKTGYQFMSDVTYQQFMSIMPQYEQIKAQIIGAGGTVTEDPLVTFFSDTTNPMLMTKDWKIVQYLLQQILKTEEKQLDGIYNLPAGASFYVPFQALALQPQGKGGLPGEPIAELKPATQEFSRAVDMFGNTVTMMVDIFGRPLVGPSGQGQHTYMQKGVYANEFGQPLLGPVGGRVIPEDYWKAKYEELQKYHQQMIAGQPLTPFVDIYGRPTTGPSGGTSGPIAGGTFKSEPTPPGFYAHDIDFSSLIGKIDNLITTISNWLLGKNTDINGLGTPESFATPPTTTTEVPPVNTSLNLTLNSQTQLIVDGRLLADIVKPYLVEDLLAYEGSAGGATQSYTFA